MSSWLSRIRTDPTPQNPFLQNLQSPLSAPALAAQLIRPKIHDPNAPDYRLQFSKKCIYERRLPGGAYITAHLERLQDGFYDSPVIHEDCIENVRFIAVTFVFHPKHTSNRFTAAMIKLALHDDVEHHDPDAKKLHELEPEDIKNRARPKFLRFAPHLLYGALSPETLTWNFNLAGSLGVSQTPVSASLAPSGGMKGSYKLFEMMKIQGSVRTLRSWVGHEYDIEDGEMVWTLEENSLQKSGLPREFTFVMLVTKGDARNVVFDIDIQPDVSAWFGTYPRAWIDTSWYRPLHKDLVDLDHDVGQRFEPVQGRKGFNFANLASTFDEFVSLPGTTFSTSDQGGGSQAASGQSAQTPGAGGGQAQQKNQAQGQQPQHQQQQQGQQAQSQSQQQAQQWQGLQQPQPQPQPQSQQQQPQPQHSQQPSQQLQTQNHAQPTSQTQHPTSTTPQPQTLNVRVFIEGLSSTPSHPGTYTSRGASPSPSHGLNHRTYTITSSKPPGQGRSSQGRSSQLAVRQDQRQDQRPVSLRDRGERERQPSLRRTPSRNGLRQSLGFTEDFQDDDRMSGVGLLHHLVTQDTRRVSGGSRSDGQGDRASKRYSLPAYRETSVGGAGGGNGSENEGVGNAHRGSGDKEYDV